LTGMTVTWVAEPGAVTRAPATLTLNGNPTATAVVTLTVGPLPDQPYFPTRRSSDLGHGALAVTTGAISDVSVTGESSGTLTLSGDAADVHTELARLTYTPTTEYEGTDTLSVTVTSIDGSNTSATQGTASTPLTGYSA